jgi:hypothetical protein
MESAMSAEYLGELELSRWDWSALRAVSGHAGLVPDALRAMFKSTTPEEAKSAYWRLENYVVVQGQLSEAAVPVVSVVLAALAWPDRPRWVRISLLELLFQIVNGYSDQSEVALGSDDLDESCKASARQGLWVLYRELVDGERAAAKDVLEVIEVDHDRLVAVLASLR